MDAQTIRAAIYTRVSTEEQAKEGFSLDAQLENSDLIVKHEIGWLQENILTKDIPGEK